MQFNFSGYAAALLAWLFMVPAHAQVTINGMITDSLTGEPVEGAIITAENSFINAISDDHGSFTIPVSGNDAKISITHLSYETRVLNAEAGMKINLLRKTYLSEEVNIISTRAGQHSPFANTLVTKTEIAKVNAGQDLPYLLQTTPSVVVTSDAGNGVGYTGIRIRGSDATRINVTLNGIPVNDAESHQVYWVDIPDLASSVEDIQIQRGIGTSTNGAGAFGGSINVETSRLRTEPFIGFNMSAGSFNTFKKTLSLGTGLLPNKFSLDARLSQITSDGFIDRATSDLRSFYLNGGYYGAKTSIRFVVLSGTEKTYQSWYGIPEEMAETNPTYNPAGEYTDINGNIHYYDNQTDNYQQDYYQLLFSRELNPRWHLNLAIHLTRGRGYYEEFRETDDFEDYSISPITIGDSLITASDLVRQKWLSNYFYGATYSLMHTLKKTKLYFGGATTRFDGEHFGEVISMEIKPVVLPHRYYHDDARKTDISFYAKAIHNLLPGLNLLGDLQVRLVDYEFEGLSNEFLPSIQNVQHTFFNPKGGITWDFSPGQQLYASVAVGHKEPVRDDYIVSTPANFPRAEEMIDYEAGYSYKSGKFQSRVGLYYMDYRSQLILTGKINEVGEYIRQSVGESYRAGVEIEAEARLSSFLALAGNITLSENKIREFHEFVDNYDDGTQGVNIYRNTDIAFSPSLIASPALRLTPVKNLDLDFNAKVVGEQFLDNTSDRSRMLDAYTVLNAAVNYSLQVKPFRTVSIRLLLNNLADEIYMSNGYTYSGVSGGTRYDYNFVYPQAGFNWLASVGVNF